MPTYMFEAIDAATGAPIKDTVDAASEAEAQATIRSMGYMVTKLKVKKAAAAPGSAAAKKKRGFVFGKVKGKDLTLFTLPKTNPRFFLAAALPGAAAAFFTLSFVTM